MQKVLQEMNISRLNEEHFIECMHLDEKMPIVQYCIV